MKTFIFSSVMFFMAAATVLIGQNKIGCQAWSFNAYTLEETLEKMESLDIKYLEMYPKQRMSPSDSSFTTFKMPKDQIVKLKSMLKKHHVKVISYGVISLRKRSDWVQLFVFAKEMGIKTIVTEPDQNQIPVIDELCQKYKIYAAIHNHAKPKRHWWNPANVKDGILNRSKYLGVCADVGHWKRSDLDIISSLKLLEGKIFELHVKDVDVPTLNAKWVPMGEGIIPWSDVFQELKRQNFKGNYIIEHVAKKDVIMDDMRVNLELIKANLK